MNVPHDHSPQTTHHVPVHSVTCFDPGTSDDRREKAAAKVRTFFDKLAAENPEVNEVHWMRG